MEIEAGVEDTGITEILGVVKLVTLVTGVVTWIIVEIGIDIGNTTGTEKERGIGIEIGIGTDTGECPESVSTTTASHPVPHPLTVHTRVKPLCPMNTVEVTRLGGACVTKVDLE